jgi:DNA-binding beta-propeller fold protein YncE
VIILHAVGVPGLKRTLIVVSLLLPVTCLFPSCSSSNGNTSSGGSGLKFRAFISQDVSAGAAIVAGVQILDAEKDLRAFVAPISAGATPGQMVVTPNRGQTLVFSPTGNTMTLINNATEASGGSITLPGFTESFVVSPDSQTVYIAVPTAPVVGQSPGATILNLSSGNRTAEIPVPAVRFRSAIVQSAFGFQ